jgi:DNA polymerase III subunit beta
MVTVGFAADVLEPGATAVSAEALSKLIDALPEDADISITVHGTTACLGSGQRRFRLSTIVGDVLPPDLVLDAETGTTVLPRADAHALFTYTSFAAASAKDARTYLGGVFLHNVDSALVAVATESHILARYSVATTGVVSTDRRLILPMRAAGLMTKVLADKTLDHVTLRASKNLFVLESADVTFVTRLIGGTFPNYEAAIPKPPAGGATVVRDELLPALARALAVSDGRRLRLTWSDTELRLEAIDSDVIDDGVGATVSQPGSTAVDAQRLNDLVKELPGKRLTLGSSEPREPVRITVEGLDNFFAILAPINVGSAT